MRRTWQLRDARNRFSEVVDLAASEGPQTVTRRGREVAVIVAIEDYLRLTKPKASFKNFLLSAPRVSLKIERDPDPERDVDSIQRRDRFPGGPGSVGPRISKRPYWRK